MAFFLIVPSVMVVSIVLIHALAKRLGLQIYYSTLIATAILSFMVIFAAFILSPVPDKKFFLYLGGLVLLTSFLLTLINNFLIKKQRDEEKIFTEQVKAAYAEEIKKDSAKPVAKNVVEPIIGKFEWQSSRKNEVDEMSDATPAKENIDTAKEIAEPVETSKPAEEFPLENVFKPLNEVKAEAVAKALQDKSATPFEEPKPEENFPLQDAFNPLDKNKSEETKKALSKESAVPFEEPKPEENFPLQETFKALDEVKPDMLKKIKTEVTPMELPEKLELIAEENSELTVELSKPESVEEIPPPLEPAKPVEEIPTPIEPAKPVEKIPPPLEPAKPVEEISTPIELAKPVEEISPPIEPAKPVEEISPPIEPAKPVEEISTPLEPAKPVEEISPPIEPAKPVEEISPPIELAKPVEEISETLDSILDKAYDARAKGHMWQAMAFYKKALERYNDDEYAPFVAIDLGNLYKENALYTKAIKIYEEALDLPAVKRNAETKKDFANNLKYLRVVRDILLKHNAASTPFDKIPREILQEIDAEFQKTQLHAV